MRYFILLCFIFGLFQFSFSQSLVDVTDLNFSFKGKKKMYYGFQKGDRIVFDFNERKGKKLKRITIRKFPNDVKFTSLKPKEVKGKTITVNEKCVVEFELESKKKRNCNVKIQRIPSSDRYLRFDTGVEWVDIDQPRRILEKTDTQFVVIKNTKERVHSITHLKKKGNVTKLNIPLPENSYYPNRHQFTSRTLLTSWVMSIATEGEGTKWYEKAETKALSRSGIGLAIESGIISTGYGALALLVLEGVSTFADPPEGENIKWVLKNEEGVVIDKGNSILLFGKYTGMNTEGTHSLELKNDNLVNAVNVEVKIVGLQIQEHYKEVELTNQEKKALLKANGGQKKIPVNVEDVRP